MLLHRTILALAAAFFLLLIGPYGAIADEYEDAVKSAYSAWDAAFNSKDANALAAFYTDDAYLLPPNHKIFQGPKGVAEFFSGLFSGGVTGHKLEIIEAHGNGNIVYGAARWSASGKDDKGQPATFTGVATHVFEKQPDGKLKLKLHTFN